MELMYSTKIEVTPDSCMKDRLAFFPFIGLEYFFESVVVLPYDVDVIFISHDLAID